MINSSTQTDTPGITFDVADVAPAQKAYPTVNTRLAAEALLGASVEASSDYASNCCGDITTNPLVTAASIAHGQHRALELSPDVIWLTILQGLSIHFEENWGQWKNQVIVGPYDHREVQVSTADFPVGSLESPWGQLVEDATSTAYGAVDETVANLFGVSFSTTSRNDRVAMDLAFLAAVNSYLSLYDVTSICGIPQITLTGTPTDWHRIRQMVDTLDQFGLSWWTIHLRPICDQFIAASDGSPDVSFWQQIYSTSDAICGTLDRVTGWIGKLFPYLSTTGFATRRNPLFIAAEPPTIEEFPIGLREVSMRSQRGTTVQLAGGLIGVQQANDLTLSAKTGWAVRRQSSLESLLAQCEHSPAIRTTVPLGKARVKLHSRNLELHQFYHRFETLTSTNNVTCHFLSPTETDNVREQPPVKILAELDNERWLGAVEIINLNAIKAMFERREPLRTAFFIGDATTRQPKGEADFVTISFEQILGTLVSAIEANTLPEFAVVGRIDPQDKDALSALFPA